VKYLLDTHLLLWAASDKQNTVIISNGALTDEARALIDDFENELLFSAAGMWEIAIKAALGKPDFQVDPNVFRTELLSHGYVELPVSSAHAVAIAQLPSMPDHKDPFDRLLIAQAIHEGITLMTSDRKIAAYSAAPIKYVGP
jgi:PIN domain nuclease of toxin-antitoxin system